MFRQDDSAIFFDFDGVLVDSLQIKTQAYETIFEPYGRPAVSAIVDYHRRHGGISRVEKIIHAHRHILEAPYLESEVEQHIRYYSELVFERVITADWIPGAREFLEANYRDRPIFVISGTPDEELKEIVSRRSMGHYFQEVHGAPTSKIEHIQALLAGYQLSATDCFFIGDALTDYHAARTTGVPFIGVQGEVELPPDAIVLPDCLNLVRTMEQLSRRLAPENPN